MGVNQKNEFIQNQYILWRIYIKVNKKEKIEKELFKLKKFLDTEFLDVKSKKYWKDDSLFEVIFKTKLKNIKKSKVIVEMLNYADDIAYSINITDIDEFIDGEIKFEIILNKLKISSLKWCIINLI